MNYSRPYLAMMEMIERLAFAMFWTRGHFNLCPVNLLQICKSETMQSLGVKVVQSCENLAEGHIDISRTSNTFPKVAPVMSTSYACWKVRTLE